MPHLFANSIPPDKPDDIVAWAEENVHPPLSALANNWRASITPWTVEPIRMIREEGVRRISMCGPVQTGKSTVGQVALCWWLAFDPGYVQCNWDSDKKAASEWKRSILPLLQHCNAFNLPEDIVIGEIVFPAAFLKVQGVFNPQHLDSTPVAHQINEEIHEWEPGHLQKADGRLTTVWNHKVVDCSNASKKGDQWHQKFSDGTCQNWEVKCPGCGLYHEMRTKWEPERPDLGGLRYDSDGCRMPDGSYDYNRLAPTIRYQMPCGYQVHDIPRERRPLSLSGRYSEPTNKGSETTVLRGQTIHLHRSYRYEAVAVDFISWVQIIREKHIALRVLKAGDPMPWSRYLRERECIFEDLNELPLTTALVLSRRRMSEDGMPGRAYRFAFLDRQPGSVESGTVPYWWCVVRDWDNDGNSLLVFEGKLQSDAEAVSTMQRLALIPRCVACDSGDDTTAVYQFCLEHGYNATKGEGRQWYKHKDGSLHAFSDETSDYLCLRANRPARTMQRDRETEAAFLQRAATEEPRFWTYSRDTFYDRLSWLKSGRGPRWEVPANVSDTYRSQIEAWTVVRERNAHTNEIEAHWIQQREHDHLWACEAGVTMLAEMAGIIGAGVVERKT